MTAKRLLVVDDEADFGASVRRIAEKLGFEVETITDGRCFKDVYGRFDPAVIILDLIMPDVDGLELIDWLASVRCAVPIIIISGSAPIYAKAAMSIGEARGLLSITRLVKPVSLETLKATLTTAFEAFGDIDPPLEIPPFATVPPAIRGLAQARAALSHLRNAGTKLP